MTAYGAAISLKNTIEYIRHSSDISLVGRSKQIVKIVYKKLQPLQEILERLDKSSKSKSRKKVNELDGRIKDKLWEIEDLLDSLLTDQILSQLQTPPSDRVRIRRRRRTSNVSIIGGWLRSKRDAFLFSIDLQSLRGDVDSFTDTLKEMEIAYIHELENMAEDEECISSGIGFGGTKPKMFGLSDLFEKVHRTILGTYSSKIRGARGVYSRSYVYALVGMAGVGKTTLAMEIYEDEEILRCFDHRAWVVVGRKLQFNEVGRDVLAQLCGVTLLEAGDEEIGGYMKQRLEGMKCLIVLDDVWETELVDSFIESLPYDGSIQILLTARETEVIARVTCPISAGRFEVVRFLNEEESKDLLCHKVFGDKDLCPPELDKAATEIAKKCEGLPLMIVTVADILSKSQNIEPGYWNEVAKPRSSVFTDAYNEISKVLYPSYDYLPLSLKMLFLYMGVLPPDYGTPLSRIIIMLTAEGWFLDTNKNRSLEESVWKCLGELCLKRNLVLFNKKSISWHWRNWHGVLKTCRLHSSWWHLCRGEARKHMFYHVLNRLVDAEEGAKGQRCLCLENNLLFGIKEFFNSVGLHCASSTRSLLFIGPYHQYPVPIDVGFELLSKLDALQLRFYTFPTEILTLILLKYLALTCNGELPSTISKLFNLRVLIIHPHMRIRHRAPSYVPTQVWDMQKLEHIEILGKSLVGPNIRVPFLENLSTLVGVNASICTILELSKNVPHIRKLGVQIELTPYDDHNDLLSCFSCIATLGSLETLKCSVTNPVLKYGSVFPSTPTSLMLPRGLIKLHLSGMGFPWEYMDVIGSLPLLKVLKLRSYAFRGPNWEVHKRSFISLEFLLIEDSDLVQWKPTFRNKLEEINFPSGFRHMKIELVDSQLLLRNYNFFQTIT